MHPESFISFARITFRNRIIFLGNEMPEYPCIRCIYYIIVLFMTVFGSVETAYVIHLTYSYSAWRCWLQNNIFLPCQDTFFFGACSLVQFWNKICAIRPTCMALDESQSDAKWIFHGEFKNGVTKNFVFLKKGAVNNFFFFFFNVGKRCANRPTTDENN